MPDVAALAQALSDAGGWAVAVAMGAGLGFAFVRGWIVPRFAYDREVARNELLSTQATRNAEAIERLTDSVDRIIAAAIQKARDA